MAKAKRGRSTVAIDDHVAGRIRERRIMLGLTQQQLAEMISATARSFLNFDNLCRTSTKPFVISWGVGQSVGRSGSLR